MNRPQQMPADAKEVLRDAMRRRESLQVCGGLEPPHLPLAMPRRLMGDLGPIVGVWAVT